MRDLPGRWIARYWICRFLFAGLRGLVLRHWLVGGRIYRLPHAGKAILFR